MFLSWACRVFRNSHAVQGNPPKAATGRVAAVRHIHLIYKSISFKVNKLSCSKNSCHMSNQLSKIRYTVLIFGRALEILKLLHRGSGIRQGVCVSISMDVCFKYKALMLTFGRGRESRSWDQLEKMIKRRKRKSISSQYHEKIVAATGKDIPFQAISNFVDCTTLYKHHVLSESIGSTKDVQNTEKNIWN